MIKEAGVGPFFKKGKERKPICLKAQEEKYKQMNFKIEQND